MRAILSGLCLVIALLAASPAHAVSKFWVGGAGDCSDTAHWSLASGGAGGAAVPGASDTPTWNSASGGGVVTCTGPQTWQGLSCGTFGGTLTFIGDFTLTGAGAAFDCSGSGSRTINAGNGTWTIDTTDAAPINIGTTTGLTFNAQGSTFVIRGNTVGIQTLTIDNITWNNITIDTNTSRGVSSLTGPVTIANLSIASGRWVLFAAASNFTIGTLLAIGTSTFPVMLQSATDNTTVNIAATNVTINYAGLRGLAVTGGTFSAANSQDQGLNTGITIIPAGGGGGGGGGGLSIGGREQRM